MVKRIIIWVLVIALAYFFFSTVAKTCNNPVGDAAGTAATTIGNATEKSVNKAKEIASFEDDDYAIDDEDDRTSNKSVELDEEDKAYNDDGDSSDLASEDDLEKSNERKEIEAEKEKALEEEREAKASAARAAERSTTSSSSSSSSSKSSSSAGNYKKFLVVTGSYKEKSNAEAMVTKLKKMGHSGSEEFTFDFAEYYSVTAGRYDTIEDAREVVSELKAKGIDCYAHKMRSKYFD